MDYQPLGRTGLTVSVVGIGTGGPSQLGVKAGVPEAESIAVIREAFEAGVNFIDTAEAYLSEGLVGTAIDGIPRDQFILSTKISSWDDLDTEGVVRLVEERLRVLRTDYLDVCHVHAVRPHLYDRVVDVVYPGLVRARDQGKIRFIGITEMFNADPGHEMLSRAVTSSLWDVIMVGFNILNQSARDRVLEQTRRTGIGVLAMFAVRLALSRPARLREVITGLLADGSLSRDELVACGGSVEDPLGFVTRETDAATLVEAAYRFVRHEPGIDVTLSGTGNPAHMAENIESCQLPPLDPEIVARLRGLFQRVDSVTAQ